VIQFRHQSVFGVAAKRGAKSRESRRRVSGEELAVG